MDSGKFIDKYRIEMGDDRVVSNPMLTAAYPSLFARDILIIFEK